MPARWMADSAVSVATAGRTSPLPVRGPSDLTSSCSERPGMYSLTMYGWPSSVAPTSRTLAVEKTATRLAASASRRKRRCASPAVSTGSRNILIATLPSPGARPR